MPILQICIVCYGHMVFAFQANGLIEYDPASVFNAIYRAPCLKALRASRDSLSLADCHDRCIKNNILAMFLTIRQKSQTSAELHRSNAGHQMEYWARLKSNETCLCCLRRKPEHVSTCGHALCDVCVEIYGNAVSCQEYCYELPTCILCKAGRLTAKIKPPTAGVRILSIDGGGVRGVVPLEFLDLLQKEVGETCPIQDLFDLAIGTSSGLLCSCVHPSHC